MAGRRASAGEVISTAFTESAVNQVISKRMVKKQQMRWTPRGAHLLLQVRARVLNDQLDPRQTPSLTSPNRPNVRSRSVAGLAPLPGRDLNRCFCAG